MRSDDHRAMADPDAKAVEIGLRRPGQHHAGPVIAIKHQGLFNRPLRQHHLPGPHPPQPFARRAVGPGFQMIGQLLAQADHVLMIIADGGCPAHQPHVRQRLQFRQSGSQPSPRRRALYLDRRLRQQRPAHFRVLVHNDNIRRGTPRRQRGGQTGRPRADDQHITVQIA